MRDFFFDTANVDFIKSTMDKYGSDINPKWVRGVTTDPNAFSKIDKYHLDEWLDHAVVMGKLVADIMGTMRVKFIFKHLILILIPN